MIISIKSCYCCYNQPGILITEHNISITKYASNILHSRSYEFKNNIKNVRKIINITPITNERMEAY